VARRFIPEDESQTTLFTLGRYVYRAWVTNLDLTPVGVGHFYDGRAGREPRICERREDFALRNIPTAPFAAKGTRPVNPFRSFPCGFHGLYSVTSKYDMDCGILIRGG